MSVATKRGDRGETSLVGSVGVSKGAARVEAYGTLDELISSMGFARSICDDTEVRERTKSIQRELFAVSSALTTPFERTREPDVTASMIDALTADLHRLEAMDGVLRDWSIPGEHVASAAYHVARTICRRAERLTVRLAETEPVAPEVIAHLNRLSDLLWLFGRIIEVRAGIDSLLRGPELREDGGRLPGENRIPALMVLGTASHVGKSVTTAARRRILREDGRRRRAVQRPRELRDLPPLAPDAIQQRGDPYAPLAARFRAHFDVDALYGSLDMKVPA